MESTANHIDNEIIDILKKNSRASYAEIGRTIGLSPSAVREHVQKLEDTGIIESYGVKINHGLLGFGMEVFILLKIFDGKLNLFLNEIKSFKEVEEAHRITGPYNIHIKAHFKDQKHLLAFIDKLIGFGSPTTLLVLSDI